MFTPNASEVVYSVGMRAFVALHTFADGQTWLVRKHPNANSWITVRRATDADRKSITDGVGKTLVVIADPRDPDPDEWDPGYTD